MDHQKSIWLDWNSSILHHRLFNNDQSFCFCFFLYFYWAFSVPLMRLFPKLNLDLFYHFVPSMHFEKLYHFLINYLWMKIYHFLLPFVFEYCFLQYWVYFIRNNFLSIFYFLLLIFYLIINIFILSFCLFQRIVLIIFKYLFASF